MRKFKCKGCENHCELTPKERCFFPKFCPFAEGYEPVWHEVKEDNAENAQVDVKSEQLPAWVKVGAVGYDDMNNEYFEVIKVNNDSFRAKYIDSSDPCSGLYFNEFCSEARKRPFNDKEMREIVGKNLETPGFVKFIFSYDKENKTLESYDFLYTADDLFEDDFKFEGKPCYKLEHLNEKGEWVE